MKSMYAMVFLLIAITCASSIICVSSNNDAEQDIFMVVDNQMTMHDAGIRMSKDGIGKFVLEDGKALTLSRKSSLSESCITPDQPCGALHWCCEGLYCDGFFNGKCHIENVCIEKGQNCNIITSPCCYPSRCSGTHVGSKCV